MMNDFGQQEGQKRYSLNRIKETTIVFLLNVFDDDFFFFTIPTKLTNDI